LVLLDEARFLSMVPNPVLEFMVTAAAFVVLADPV